MNSSVDKQALKERAARADGEATRSSILDAADELFCERGFSAASIRAIADSANVNLAAINYHFGSKKGLLTAALHRLTVPINDLRRLRLDDLEKDGRVPTVEEVMRAFFAPLLEEALTGKLPRLIARLYAEPGAQELLESEFGATLARFIESLHRALPEISIEELRWRFHLIIGAMVHLLNFESPPGMPAPGGEPAERVERLVRFSVSGLTQDKDK